MLKIMYTLQIARINVIIRIALGKQKTCWIVGSVQVVILHLDIEDLFLLVLVKMDTIKAQEAVYLVQLLCQAVLDVRMQILAFLVNQVDIIGIVLCHLVGHVHKLAQEGVLFALVEAVVQLVVQDISKFLGIVFHVILI